MVRAAAATLVVLAASVPAHALLAVFTDGRVLRVEDARLEGASLVLTLPGGGILEVAATRIDRVVSDEITRIPLDAPVGPVRCSWRWRDEPLPEWTPFRTEIATAARTFDLHPWLVAAVVEAESAYEPTAVSRAGAAGLMQLMPAAAADHGVTDPFDPQQNLAGGAAHLRSMLNRFDDLQLALAAYNAGAATVDRHGGVPPYGETRRYIHTVLTVFCPASLEGDPAS